MIVPRNQSKVRLGAAAGQWKFAVKDAVLHDASASEMRFSVSDKRVLVLAYGSARLRHIACLREQCKAETEYGLG